jgi:membrane associated rhomboid family serine protease
MGIPDFLVEIGGKLRLAADLLLIKKDHHHRSIIFNSGPLIPSPTKDMFTGESVYCGLSLLRLKYNVEKSWPITASVSTAVAFLPYLFHVRTYFGTKYRLHDVGLNPRRVIARGEWHRIVTSQLYTSSFVQLIDNVNDMFDYGTLIEKRWGWRGYLGALGAVTSLGSALYSEVFLVLFFESRNCSFVFFGKLRGKLG